MSTSRIQSPSDSWLCDQCGHDNDVESWPCESCRYPLVYTKQIPKKHIVSEFPNQRTQKLNEKWECTHCKKYNKQEDKRCKACFTIRGASQKEQKKANRTGKLLQQSTEELFSNLKSFGQAEELIGNLPDKFNENWITSDSKFYFLLHNQGLMIFNFFLQLKVTLKKVLKQILLLEILLVNILELVMLVVQLFYTMKNIKLPEYFFVY